jgi:hypothetical protein
MPPTTAAENAINPGRIPMSGSIPEARTEYRTPATAANAEPSANVNEITRLLFTPINAAACWLNETARIAIPIRVRCTNHHNPISNPQVTSGITMSTRDTVAPKKWICSAGSSCGKGRVFAPNTAGCWHPNSMSNDTPIAVISTVNFGRFLNGRYARYSIPAPTPAHATAARKTVAASSPYEASPNTGASAGATK